MSRLIWLVLLFYLILTIAFGIVNPLFEAPDEQHHFFNALAIADSWQLPQADENSLARQEAAQPPLYYGMAAGLLKLLPIDTDTNAFALWSNPYVEPGNFDAVNNFNAFIHPAAETSRWQGLALGVHVLRLFSTALGLGTLLLIARSSLLLWPNDREKALLATAVVAFLPQFEFLHAAVTNDTLIIFLSSAALWQMIGLYQRPTSRRWFLLSGTIGLAILSKLTGLLLFGCALPLLLLTAMRTRAWRIMLYHLFLLFVPALAVAGWLFYRNWLLYGNLTAVNVFIEFAGGDRHFPLWVIYAQLDRLWASAIAIFGWMNVRPPAWIFHLWTMLIAWVSGGLLIALVRGLLPRWRLQPDAAKNRRTRERTLLWVILFGWPLLVLGAWIQFALHTHADQGRLLFPALLPIALAAAYGLTQWRLPLFRWFVLCALLAPPLFVVSYWLPTRYAPLLAYRDTPLPSAVNPLQLQVNEEIELVGATVNSPTIQPGQAIELELYWRKVKQSSTPAVVSWEVVGRGYHTIGELPPSYHGGGTTPSTLWPVDTVMVEKLVIGVDAAATAPTMGRLWLRLAGKADLMAIGMVKIVPKQWPTPAATPLAQLGDGILITAATVTPTVSVPGGAVTLQLQWQIEQAPTSALVTFVHLGDPLQQPLAQADGPALQGDYPAQVWEAGEVVDDSYSLILPATLPEDEYPLYVGLYDPGSGQRLPLSIAGARISHDGLLAGWVTVQHE